jgi:phage repressor protein C with HTH and peptisase S24 domain
VKVAGDSMVPVLDQRDVILIQLDTKPRVDDLIVARLPDQSHVVKRVASIRNGRLELASFNPAYAPVYVSRDDPSSVVGTVIARFTHEM